MSKPTTNQFLKPLEDDQPSFLAISTLVNEYFVKKSIDFELINCYSQRQQLIDKIGSASGGNATYLVRNISKQPDLISLNSSAVILTENVYSLLYILDSFRMDNKYPKKLIYFAFLDTSKDFISKMCIRGNLTNEVGRIDEFLYILLEDANYIHLQTFYWHTDEACDAPQLNIFNHFSKVTKKWHWPLRDLEKFKNFHRCPLVSGQLHNFRQFIYQDRFNGRARGIMVELAEILAERVNFTARFALPKNYSMNTNFEDFTYFRQFHIVTGIKMNMLTGTEHITMTFFQNSFIFVITPSVPLTNFEKMLLPFDIDTWMYLGITFCVVFSAILVINQLSDEIKDLVYGEAVRTPVLNIFYIFFGIGQMKLPEKWFARFLLIIFILFCLIFRTCYQSKLFEFMTSDMRKSSPETVEDLYEQGFTIYSVGYRHILEVLHNVIDEKRR